MLRPDNELSANDRVGSFLHERRKGGVRRDIVKQLDKGFSIRDRAFDIGELSESGWKELLDGWMVLGGNAVSGQ